MTIGKRRRKGGKKEKTKTKEKEKGPVANPNQQINRFFNNSTLKTAFKSKPAPVSYSVQNYQKIGRMLKKCFCFGQQQIDEEESEDFMADLLSGFGSSKTKPAATKQPLLNKAKPRTVAPSISRANMTSRAADLSIKEEHVYKELSSYAENPATTNQKKVVIENNVEDDDTFADFDDDMMEDMLLDEQLKKEVDNLSIAEAKKPNFTAVSKFEERPDLQNWQAAESGMIDTFNQDAIKEESQNVDILEENGNLKMWWYDAYERREKGYVYIFGKVLNKKTNKYVSCCVTVKNIERNLFVLPRKFELDGIVSSR